MWHILITLGLIPSMTNFHLSDNSILWFCGEVVAKNNKRTGRTTGLGLGEECIGKWNPDTVEGSWPSTGSSPLPSLSRGYIPRKRSLSSLRTQYCLHAPGLLPSCSLAPASLDCFFSPQDHLKAPNKIIIYQLDGKAENQETLLGKNGGVYQIWHQADLPTWGRGNEFKWSTLTPSSATCTPQSRRPLR